MVRHIVTVTDTGIGIPAEHLPHVFDRFYRVDSSRSPETEGTGLGLAICRSIAEAHAGRLEIDSTPGSGTRVYTSHSPATRRCNHPRTKDRTTALEARSVFKKRFESQARISGGPRSDCQCTLALVARFEIRQLSCYAAGELIE